MKNRIKSLITSNKTLIKKSEKEIYKNYVEDINEETANKLLEVTYRDNIYYFFNEFRLESVFNTLNFSETTQVTISLIFSSSSIND